MGRLATVAGQPEAADVGKGKRPFWAKIRSLAAGGAA
jgi:hypothetical protein